MIFPSVSGIALPFLNWIAMLFAKCIVLHRYLQSAEYTSYTDICRVFCICAIGGSDGVQFSRSNHCHWTVLHSLVLLCLAFHSFAQSSTVLHWFPLTCIAQITACGSTNSLPFVSLYFLFLDDAEKKNENRHSFICHHHHHNNHCHHQLNGIIGKYS